MAKSLQLKYAIWLYLLLNWTAVAYAAENPLVEGLEAIPGKAIAYVLALSVVGGAAGTLTKLARPDIVIRSLGLEISKDVATSVLAGILMFFATSWTPWVTFWPQAIAITMAGYGGSKTLDLALNDGFFPWMRSVAQRVLGVKPDGGAS